MGKKKKHEEHENLERWLVSYADFITLLFATFTALYALSVADLAKMKDVAQSIRDGFQSQSLISGINSIIQGKSAPSANTNPLSKETGEGQGLLGKHESLTFTKGDTKKTKEAVRNLKKTVSAVNATIKGLAGKMGGNKGDGGKGGGKSGEIRGVELSVQDRGLRISFDSSLLFEPGSAALRKESKVILGGIAPDLYLMSKTNFIHIEGHTDNTPISTASYPSNWELSSARASSVVRFLIGSHHFEPSHMAAVGYGETRPFTTNATPEGREKNRRIDVIIYSYEAGQSVDVRAQYMGEDSLVKSEDGEGKHSAPTPPKPTTKVIQAKDSMGSKPVTPGLPQSVQPINPIPSQTHKRFDPLAPTSHADSPKPSSANAKPNTAHANTKPSGETKPSTHTSPAASHMSSPSSNQASPAHNEHNTSSGHKPASKPVLIQSRDEN